MNKTVEFICRVKIRADDEKSFKDAVKDVKRRLGVGQCSCFGSHNWSYKSVGNGKVMS